MEIGLKPGIHTTNAIITTTWLPTKLLGIQVVADAGEVEEEEVMLVEAEDVEEVVGEVGEV